MASSHQPGYCSLKQASRMSRMRAPSKMEEMSRAFSLLTIDFSLLTIAFALLKSRAKVFHLNLIYWLLLLETALQNLSLRVYLLKSILI